MSPYFIAENFKYNKTNIFFTKKHIKFNCETQKSYEPQVG